MSNIDQINNIENLDKSFKSVTLNEISTNLLKELVEKNENVLKTIVKNGNYMYLRKQAENQYMSQQGYLEFIAKTEKFFSRFLKVKLENTDIAGNLVVERLEYYKKHKSYSSISLQILSIIVITSDFLLYLEDPDEIINYYPNEFI